MFDGIARRYDLLNHLLSLNQDARWRRRAAEALGTLDEDPSARVLDLCGGTGDQSLAVVKARRAGLVVCCDFSYAMLERAVPKLRGRAVVLQGDGLALPFADATFDGVTVSFGVRNFHDMDAGLREIFRVLRPGGRLVVLEFSAPTAPVIASLYRFYLKRVLPRLGDGVSGKSGPYGYLARTISEFDDPAALAGRMREAGFAGVGWTPITGGIVCLHTAMKASSG
jgi:demethylmenaquinone methyltransferase/2-methoxy-6-polyprenyl-1,4-benzoquinol methylase